MFERNASSSVCALVEVPTKTLAEFLPTCRQPCSWSLVESPFSHPSNAMPHAFSHAPSSCQAATDFERPHQDLFYYQIRPQSGSLARTPSHSMEAILNEFAVQPWVRSRQFLHFLKIQSSTLSIVYICPVAAKRSRNLLTVRRRFSHIPASQS